MFVIFFIESDVNNEHTNNIIDIPIQITHDEMQSPEEREKDEQRQTIIPFMQTNSVINNNHNDESR